jgi:hypothetical protein
METSRLSSAAEKVAKTNTPKTAIASRPADALHGACCDELRRIRG